VLIDEGLPQLDTMRTIDIQQDNRDAADFGSANEDGANPLEMSLPALPARMEKSGDLAREGIQAA
jgi:hypothetical protein